jgi:hypothetical protein
MFRQELRQLPEVNIIAKEGLDKVAAILRIKASISWHTVVYKKRSCKAKKEFLESYKKTNAIARLTAASTALKDFVVDTSMIMSEVDAIILFKEQYTLVKLIDNEEEAAKYSLYFENL